MRPLPMSFASSGSAVSTSNRVAMSQQLSLYVKTLLMCVKLLNSFLLNNLMLFIMSKHLYAWPGLQKVRLVPLYSTGQRQLLLNSLKSLFKLISPIKVRLVSIPVPICKETNWSSLQKGSHYIYPIVFPQALHLIVPFKA